MGSSASEEDIIMATLLQAEQAAAAITTNFASFPENINNLVQQTLKPFLFFKADDQYSLQQQQQQQSVFPFPFPFPSTTATATSHLLSSLRDAGESGNHGDCDGDNRKGGLRVRTVKMKRMKGRRKVREPRFCFKTMTDVDVLDDGYKWRKYGQKVVKNTLHPRSFFFYIYILYCFAWVNNKYAIIIDFFFFILSFLLANLIYVILFMTI